MNNKKVTILFILIASLILITIGATFAYYMSSTDFENEFNTALYQTETTETFESPDNWMPGDTTPKTLTIKNSGNVDVKARVCLTEEWTSHNGDALSNTYNGQSAAIINLANTEDWTKHGKCYEYNDVLEPNDTTSSFMESVTFNSLIEPDIVCTSNTLGNTTTKTCASSGDGYDNATYTLTLRAETVQANKADEVWPPIIQYVNRQTENQITTGDEIAIDTEHFYVVSSDENETVLLSKYNLLVGDIFDYNTGNYTLVKTLSSSDTGYGLQNENAKGWIPLETGETTARYVGTVGFSGTNYWDNSACQYTGSLWGCTGTGGLKNEYANESNVEGTTSYVSPYPYVYRSNIGNTIAPSVVYNPTYGNGLVQNNGYTISYYVEEYVNTLKTLGAPDTITGRVLSSEEAVSLGCKLSSNTCKNSPATAPTWVYSTSYWLGSAGGFFSLWVVYSDGNFNRSRFDDDNYYGVRPVIILRTSDI